MPHASNSFVTRPKHQANRINDLSLASSSSKNTSVPSVTDWHRLLLSRLKPGLTGKYQKNRSSDHEFDTLASSSFEDYSDAYQSFSNDSSILDSQQILLTQSDLSGHIDSSDDGSMRRDTRYVKNLLSNRSRENITTLKRRVRKQQMRNVRHQATILHESTFQLPSPADLFLLSYQQPPSYALLPPRRYRSKNTDCVVPLPPISNPSTTPSATGHDMRVNLYGY